MATKKKAPAKKSAVKKTSAKKAPSVRKNTGSAKGNVDITIQTNGQVFEFSVAPDKISTIFDEMEMTGTNTVTKITAVGNGKTFEKVYNVFSTRRLLRQKLPRVLFQKAVRMYLDI